MLRPERFPIDFESLDRGSVISASKISEVYGVKKGTDQFRLKVVALMDEIRVHFRGRGQIISVASRHGSIHVLTHEEQDEYCRREKRRALRKFVLRHREDLATDVDALDEGAKKRRERRLEVDSWKILQLAKRKRPRLNG